ncbi:hypothetical protein [uncultured Propionibacterium sp.]|uniref:hypothetical protein n=1 Tax=uncultured Propionibacterium sp. TaxID=218066 RepID=UPI00292DB1B5|nr:hypothetical protein [uncultured Propionibacterium sp.]
MKHRILVGGVGCLAVLVTLFLVLMAVIIGAIAGASSPRKREPPPSPPAPTTPQRDDSVATPESVDRAIGRTLTADPSFQLMRIVVSWNGIGVEGLSGTRAVRYFYGPDLSAPTSGETSEEQLIGLSRDSIDLNRLQSLWLGARCDDGIPQVHVTATAGSPIAYSVLCPVDPAHPDDGGYALTDAWLEAPGTGGGELTLWDGFSSSESVTEAIDETLPALTGNASLSRIAIRQDQEDPGEESIQVLQQISTRSGQAASATHLQARGAAIPAVLASDVVDAEPVAPIGQFGWNDVDPQVLEQIAEACRGDPDVGLYQGLQVRWSEDYWQVVVTTDSAPVRTYALDGTFLG